MIEPLHGATTLTRRAARDLVRNVSAIEGDEVRDAVLAVTKAPAKAGP